MANSASTTLSVIDGATNTVTTTIGGMANPFGVAVNPSTNTVYVTNFGASGARYHRIGDQRRHQHHHGHGRRRGDGTVRPRGQSQHEPDLRGANTRSDTVSVINGATNTIAATISGLEPAPTGVAVDSLTNTIYVTNKGLAAVSVIDGIQRRHDHHWRGEAPHRYCY